MTDALENAKGQWNTACHYDKMGMGDSTLLGVESSGNLLVHNPDSGVSTMNVVGGVFVTKTLMGPSYKVVDSVSFMKVVNKNSINGIDTVDVNIFEGHEEAEISPMYAGAGIGFNLAGGQASIFDFNLGVGLSTGIGLKDDSVELKAAGTGVTVGRKISISVLDVSFGIDIVRTAQAAWFVGRELFAAVAIVPGALKNGGKDLVNEVASTPNAFYKAGGDLWHEAKKIPRAFAPIPTAFAEAGSSLGHMIAGGAVAMADGVADGAVAVADGAVAAADGVADGAVAAADGVADGAVAVADGAVAAADGVADAAEDVVDFFNPF